MIDVDNFKKYNDSFGHLAGDEVLKKVAVAVQGCLRRPGDLAARYGGEEFAAVLPGTDEAGAQLIGERICRSVEALALPHGADGAGAVVTISVGDSATKPLPDGVPAQLLALADEALYDAKRSGKNQARMRKALSVS
jgi:two-component system chemotaxis family response regulator WspR